MYPNRVALVSILVALASLLCAVPAAAQAPLPATTPVAEASATPAPAAAAYDPAADPDVAWSLSRAAAYWPSLPQSRPVVIYDENVDAIGTCAAETPGRRIYCGRTFRRLSRLEKCRHLVHEFGHLLGHDHAYDGDPDGIMIYRPIAAQPGYFTLNLARTCDLSITDTAPVIYPDEQPKPAGPAPAPAAAAPVVDAPAAVPAIATAARKPAVKPARSAKAQRAARRARAKARAKHLAAVRRARASAR